MKSQDCESCQAHASPSSGNPNPQAHTRQAVIHSPSQPNSEFPKYLICLVHLTLFSERCLLPDPVVSTEIQMMEPVLAFRAFSTSWFQSPWHLLVEPDAASMTYFLCQPARYLRVASKLPRLGLGTQQAPVRHLWKEQCFEGPAHFSALSSNVLKYAQRVA